MREAETGTLVACDTPEPLADVVSAFLADPVRRAAMGESARNWVVSHFDWNVVAAQQNWFGPAGASQVETTPARSTAWIPQ